MSLSAAPSLVAIPAALGEAAAPSVSVCWKCRGARTKLVRAPKPDTLPLMPSPKPARAHPGGVNTVMTVPCPLCAGSGVTVRTRQRTVARGAARRRDEVAPQVGPPPVQPIPLEAPAGEELCFLSGQWRIWQPLDRHRYSTDDVVTAWVAWRARAALSPAQAPATPRIADIGCGIGSVLLFNAWLHPRAVCVGLEAQAERARMAARSASLNCGPPPRGRCAVVQGDLRDPAAAAAAAAAARELQGARAAGGGGAGEASAAGGAPTDEPAADEPSDSPAGASARAGSDARPAASDASACFDLVTGTPPYFDVDIGGLPGSEETARCTFRYRGGMEAYCSAAAGMLADAQDAPRAGIFVVCDTALELPRSYAAASAAGLRVLARLDLVPKAGKPPLINVFVLAAPGAPPMPAEAFALRGVSPHGEPPGIWRRAVAEAGAAEAGAAEAGAAEAGAPPPQTQGEGSGGGAGAGETPAEAEATEDAPATAGDAPAAAAGNAPTAPTAGSTAPEAEPRAHRASRQRHKPYPGARSGELIARITVRGADNLRTAEYIALLNEMGKPG